MALDFPLNPTDGQLDSTGSWRYNSSKGAWQAVPFTPSTTVIQDTRPATASSGDVWFNSTDGTLYIYYEDVDTSQWVQIKASSALEAALEARLEALEAVSVHPIQLNTQLISSNYAIPSGYNGLTAGPVIIADGVIVTVPNGSAWSIV